MQPTRTALVAVVSVALFASGMFTISAQLPTDPCAQPAAAQVTTALGETVDPGKQGPAETCTWVANSPKHQIVTLMYAPNTHWAERKNRQVPGISKTPVSGVGDDAVAETLGNLVTLYVKKGNLNYSVRIYGVPDPARQLAIETPIAQAVAAKL